MRLLLVLCLSFVSLCAEPLSLDEALAIAEERSFELQRVQADRDASYGAVGDDADTCAYSGQAL